MKQVKEKIKKAMKQSIVRYGATICLIVGTISFIDCG
jgi:hypothetical protein